MLPPPQPRAEPEGPGTLIPPPTVIRSQLYRLRTEARLLNRLLRLSEDHVRALPPAQSSSPEPPAGPEVAHA